MFVKNQLLTFSTTSNQRLGVAEKLRVEHEAEPVNINVWCGLLQQQHAFSVVRTAKHESR